MNAPRRFLALLAAACALAGAAPAARAVVGAPTSWFAPAAVPYGVLGHADGSIWVATAGGVLRYSRAGEPLGAVTQAACASLAPCPGGDVLLVDFSGRALERRSAAGALVRRWSIAGAARDGGHVVTDAAGNAYVLFVRERDGAVAHVIRKYDAEGRTLAESEPLGAATGLTRSGEQLYAATLGGGSVRRFALDLSPRGWFTLPGGLANDLQADRDGNLLLTERFSGALRRLSPEGHLLELVHDEQPGWPETGQRWEPWGVSVAPDGTYIVSEGARGWVMLFGEQAGRERRAPRGGAPTGGL